MTCDCHMMRKSSSLVPRLHSPAFYHTVYKSWGVESGNEATSLQSRTTALENSHPSYRKNPREVRGHVSKHSSPHVRVFLVRAHGRLLEDQLYSRFLSLFMC